MGRYVDAGQIMEILPAFISTAGMTSGQVEFFVETREDEIDARLGRDWDTAVWSGNAPPMVKTLAKLGATVDIRKSKISMEDPSVSQWIVEDEKKFNDIMDLLVTGKADIVTGSGTLLQRRLPKSAGFWSSTSQYKPTRDIRDVTEQHVSRTRKLKEQADDIADSGLAPK
jgi:hypothetical protein